MNSITGIGSGAMAGYASGGWYGALAGGAMGLLSGAGQDLNNIEARKAATRMNRMQLAAWHMQNEYNSPVQQMARLKEAGLNPMLVYGGGNVSGNSSTSIGSMTTHANEVNTMAGLEGVQALENLKQTEAQTKNTQQGTLQSEANTLATYQDIDNMATANKQMQAELEMQKQQVQMGAMDLEVAKKAQALKLRDLKFANTRQDIIEAELRREGIWNESGMADVEYGAKKALGLGKDFMDLTQGLAGSQASFASANYNNTRTGFMSGYVPRYSR